MLLYYPGYRESRNKIPWWWEHVAEVIIMDAKCFLQCSVPATNKVWCQPPFNSSFSNLLDLVFALLVKIKFLFRRSFYARDSYQKFIPLHFGEQVIIWMNFQCHLCILYLNSISFYILLFHILLFHISSIFLILVILSSPGV